MYSLRTLSIYAAIAILLCVLPLAAQAQQPQTGVIATGTSTVTGTPDTAFVTFGVMNQDRDAAAAARENATKTTAVINAIVRFGIPRNNIQTVNYSVSPVMDYKQNPPVTVGYQVTNQVRVKTKDLTKTGQLIDAAVGAGANNVQSIEFTVEDPSPLRRQALVNAIADARAKAQAMADALGVKLGRVTQVSESVGITPRPMYAAARSEAAPTPILPGEVEITGNVTVVYAIL
ncbi:MAG: SIMPL domain-containing protein [Armatimonadota bacterium]|nr:SIMPL domain-containing protein [bacterium]